MLSNSDGSSAFSDAVDTSLCLSSKQLFHELSETIPVSEYLLNYNRAVLKANGIRTVSDLQGRCRKELCAELKKKYGVPEQVCNALLEVLGFSADNNQREASNTIHECLDHILSFLPFEEVMIHCARVCKSWRRQVSEMPLNQSRIHRIMSVILDKASPDSPSLNITMVRWKAVEMLQTVFSVEKVQESWSTLMDDTVDIDACLETACHSLTMSWQELRIPRTCFSLPTWALLLSKCDAITIMDLSYCAHLTDEYVHLLARHCPHLKSLDLSGCRQLTNSCIMNLVESCKEIHSLFLFDSTFSDSALDSICMFGSQLRNLGITSPNISRGGLNRILESCPNLEEQSALSLNQIKKLLFL